jgi:hypothetical protein
MWHYYDNYEIVHECEHCSKQVDETRSHISMMISPTNDVTEAKKLFFCNRNCYNEYKKNQYEEECKNKLEEKNYKTYGYPCVA